MCYIYVYIFIYIYIYASTLCAHIIYSWYHKHNNKNIHVLLTSFKSTGVNCTFPSCCEFNRHTFTNSLIDQHIHGFLNTFEKLCGTLKVKSFCRDIFVIYLMCCYHLKKIYIQLWWSSLNVTRVSHPNRDKWHRDNGSCQYNSCSHLSKRYPHTLKGKRE